MKKIIAAAALMFLFASIAQAGKPQPSAQGNWAFAFTGGTTITTGAVNIVPGCAREPVLSVLCRLRRGRVVSEL